MQANTGLAELASVIHPNQTSAEAIGLCSDVYNRSRITRPSRASSTG